MDHPYWREVINKDTNLRKHVVILTWCNFVDTENRPEYDARTWHSLRYLGLLAIVCVALQTRYRKAIPLKREKEKKRHRPASNHLHHEADNSLVHLCDGKVLVGV